MLLCYDFSSEYPLSTFEMTTSIKTTGVETELSVRLYVQQVQNGMFC
jgi:hypothetical protein